MSSNLIKNNGVIARVDRTNECLVTQDALHSNIHRGEVFEVSYVWLAVPDAAARYLLIETPTDSLLHSSIRVACTGTSVFEIWEGPTVSADGSSIAAVNRNRIVADPTASSFWFDPTVTTPGSSLHEELIPGGFGPHSGGGGASSFHEWVLAPGTRYLLEVTNISGNAQDVGIMLEGYTKEV
jgi:hypothetical protein